jgi:hypothetical protein
LPISTNYLKNVSFEDFDPNKWMTDSPVWAVYDGDGRRFKTYSKRGAALQAVMVCHKAKLYEMVGGAWVLRCIKSGYRLDNCTVCNSPITPPQGYYGAGAEWLWQKVKGKIVSPPELHYACVSCKDAVRHG